MYAVIRTGGKQYTVREGEWLDVEQLHKEPGSTVEIGEVLMVGEGSAMKVGAPYVDGARVVCEVGDIVKGEKLIIFKYKNKTRYRRKTGHRQKYTRLTVKQIVGA